MSEIEWTDAEASDLEDLAINLGHINDDPEVILRRTREIHETVSEIVAARLDAIRSLHQPIHVPAVGDSGLLPAFTRCSCTPGLLYSECPTAAALDGDA